jgi:hypothetical protein
MSFVEWLAKWLGEATTVKAAIATMDAALQSQQGAP